MYAATHYKKRTLQTIGNRQGALQPAKPWQAPFRLTHHLQLGSLFLGSRASMAAAAADPSLAGT
jgi:hypothetical protein